MANPIQWTVDVFYDQLLQLERAARNEAQELQDQKLKLQAAYSLARRQNDAAAMKFLEPLIHRNTQLRMKLSDVGRRFNAIVGQVSKQLKQVGLRVPSGLGIIPVAIVVAPSIVAGLLVLWGFYRDVNAGRIAITRAMNSDGPNLLKIANDPARTPEERAAALKSYNDLMGATQKAAESEGVFKELVPILGIAALIVLGPTLLQAFGRRAA